MKKIIKNLGIYILITFLIILPDLLFGMFNSFEKDFALERMAVIFVFNILLLSVPNRKIRFSFYSLFLIMYIVEFSNIAFFGLTPTPYTYIWMIKELGDTFDGAINSLHLIYAPFCVIIPFALLFWVDKKFVDQLPHKKWAVGIFIALLVFMAFDVNRQNRSYVYKAERGNLLTGITVIRKAIFITFKALPKIIFGGGYKNDFKPYTIEKIKSPSKINIIYIFGESANPNFMSLFEYEKKTTPSLEKFKKDPSFWYSKGFSSSISTIYSVMMNFYMQREPENYNIQKTKVADILQLAKDAGFKSWLIEAQNTPPDNEGKIDFFKDISFEIRKYGEEIAVEYFPKTNELSNKNLIIYQQDIMHFDYSKHYIISNKKWDVFKPKDDNLKEKQIAQYLNAVLYWDHIIGKIFNYADEIALETKAPTFVVYMSDHGELIGGSTRGHATLSKEVGTIPMFVKCFNCQNYLNYFKEIKTPTHYRMNEKILNLMGYKLNNPNDDGKTFYINGKSLHGDDGFITLTD